MPIQLSRTCGSRDLFTPARKSSARLSAFSFQTPPSTNISFFQMGTVALSSSMAQCTAWWQRALVSTTCTEPSRPSLTKTRRFLRETLMSAGAHAPCCGDGFSLAPHRLPVPLQPHSLLSRGAHEGGRGRTHTSSDALRCADDTAMITLASFTATTPVR